MMKVKCIQIKNFRRLECVNIDIESDHTVFVGPNNSGKTSATIAMRCFLGDKNFKVFDFPASNTDDFQAFITNDDDELLPAIELDIWFQLDPDRIPFGKAFRLLPGLSANYTEIGIGLKFEVADKAQLRSEYLSQNPVQEDGSYKENLLHYLDAGNNLNRYFHTSYYSLERDNSNKIIPHLLKMTEGKQIIENLLRVDFVDAQRNFEDDEKHRSNKLSVAFATYYKKNLEQAQVSEEAHQVIHENNERLNEHYEKYFAPLMSMIQNLGVPSVNDRDLRIVSTLSPESAFKGNTDLFYVDNQIDHSLPESYNGLGFKNLVYMAIQISHYHLQWMNTLKNRPLAQMIFIEEPEVHLHAQVQRTFIRNISHILKNIINGNSSMDFLPHLIVTTHSAHILDEVDFSKVRYFRRCPSVNTCKSEVPIYNASEVLSMKNFQQQVFNTDGDTISNEESLDFLKKYLRLTHCTLFFADAAILVEGAVEKLLLPQMIRQTVPGLSKCYITILEVGGAHAHKFSGLLKFLKIPYLVITDIDSVNHTENGLKEACPVDTDGAITSNASLKHFLNVESIAELFNLCFERKRLSEHDCFIAFQTQEDTGDHSANTLNLVGRTFEEAFIYKNLMLCRSNDLGIELPESMDKTNDFVYNFVRSGRLKKTDFALKLLASSVDWQTPEYILEGLKWLQERLKVGPIADEKK
ncbi:MAG: AAA family ATPase [Bacteroidetes bacterium]|nr:AAA family ATPase [Bacteroidota bacterium]